MQVFNVLLALGALVCSDLVSGAKHAKLVIGGAAAGGAGAIGAGGGFLAGSHIGSILAKHGYGHGNANHVLLPPKSIYLKHPEPVLHHHHHQPVEHLHAAPAHAAPIAIKHEAPIVAVHDDHHHQHHHHIEHGHEHEHHHEHHHAIEHAEIQHAAPVVPIAHEAHGHFPAPAPHFHHVEHHAHGPHHHKKPEVLYRGNIVIKKKVPAKGHHFSIHGYQFSIGRKPKILLHKKHFFFHPAPTIVKPFFVKEKAPALIKAAHPAPVPVPIKAAHGPAPIEQGPIVLIKGGPAPGHGPAAGPWSQGPIIINEGHGPIAGHQPVIKEAAAPVAGPIIKEAVVEAGWPNGGGSGGESHAPLIKILGPIFDAPLPVIGGHDAW